MSCVSFLFLFFFSRIHAHTEFRAQHSISMEIVCWIYTYVMHIWICGFDLVLFNGTYHIRHYLLNYAPTYSSCGDVRKSDFVLLCSRTSSQAIDRGRGQKSQRPQTEENNEKEKQNHSSTRENDRKIENNEENIFTQKSPHSCVNRFSIYHFLPCSLCCFFFLSVWNKRDLDRRFRSKNPLPSRNNTNYHTRKQHWRSLYYEFRCHTKPFQRS